MSIFEDDKHPAPQPHLPDWMTKQLAREEQAKAEQQQSHEHWLQEQRSKAESAAQKEYSTKVAFERFKAQYGQYLTPETIKAVEQRCKAANGLSYWKGA